MNKQERGAIALIVGLATGSFLVFHYVFHIETVPLLLAATVLSTIAFYCAIVGLFLIAVMLWGIYCYATIMSAIQNRPSPDAPLLSCPTPPSDLSA